MQAVVRSVCVARVLLVSMVVVFPCEGRAVMVALTSLVAFSGVDELLQRGLVKNVVGCILLALVNVVECVLLAVVLLFVVVGGADER